MKGYFHINSEEVFWINMNIEKKKNMRVAGFKENNNWGSPYLWYSYQKSVHILANRANWAYWFILGSTTSKVRYYTSTYIKGCFNLKLSPTPGRFPWWLISFKTLFYQNNCKETMNIGEVRLGVPFLTFLYWKSSFFVSFRRCHQLLK